jgi:hypothetical protein
MSPQVAEVAREALKCSDADVAVSVTGVTGPDPDERGNPVPLGLFRVCEKVWTVRASQVRIPFGALPAWPYSSSWGPYPAGGLGLVLIIVLILVLLGRI